MEQDKLMTLLETAEIISREELLKKLEKSKETGQPLKVKLGLDPSAPDIHLGHTVPLRIMRAFQDLNHEVYLIIGDFTGRIGDPSEKAETRQQLTQDEVLANARTYEEQFSKILNPDKTNLVFNSSWFNEWQTEDFLQLATRYTVARMLERDDFARRYREGRPITILEFFYPLLQGYDSVAIKADIELGGMDQKFNLLVGRQLQREYGQTPQVLIMSPLLEGTDGVQKMSKSLGNYIGINEAPGQIYGKTMSIDDELLVRYFKLTTDFKPRELEKIIKEIEEGKIHPMEAKKLLARHLVAMYHGDEAAQAAEKEFENVFSRGELPSQMPEKTVQAEWLDESGEIDLISLLYKLELVESRSWGRRMLKQGAVYIDGERVKDQDTRICPKPSMIIRVGKRRFARLSVTQ